MKSKMQGPGRWYRQKRRGGTAYQWIWDYPRPFKENSIFKSRATIERGVLEVYFHFKTPTVDRRATAKEMGRRLAALMGKPKYITSIEWKAGMARAAWYCRWEEGFPSTECMEAVPGEIEKSAVVLEALEF